MLIENFVQKDERILINGSEESYFNNETIKKIISKNTSEGFPIYYMEKDFEKEMQAFRKNKVKQVYNEINIIINHDEFIDGEISQSEIFMKEMYNQEKMDYVMESLMQIYLENLSNVHILEGVLTMISAVPYEAVEPKGQTMAMGLLTNKELLIRDRAIQCFEQWNSKKGLNVLKSLECEPKWLQKYVDKVIMYIERNGIE